MDDSHFGYKQTILDPSLPRNSRTPLSRVHRLNHILNQCWAVTWFGGLEPPVPISKNETRVGSDFLGPAFQLKPKFYTFDQPGPELDSWFHLCVWNQNQDF